MDASTPRDAAADRRQRMQVRIYSSLSAHDRDDASYWRDIPVAARVLQVWRLSEEQWHLRGESPHEPGLFQMGLPPSRIDVLTEITGVAFADAWSTRVSAPFGPVEVDVIGREAFIANKRATGRARDLGDVESLGDLP